MSSNTTTTTATAKVEYDARLGGPVQLPDAVATYRYTADRVTEIKSLLGAIRNPNRTKLVFQSLPTHMRRRAMSHNPKRLPRRHRAAHTAQMRKSGVASTTKRPSRKYRRKAGNLQREYERRQRRHVWLETHLWHAKRFHMVERWGYKLPLRTCDKTFRCAYRASAEHCLLQDVSYVAAIEMSGPLRVLRDGFAAITSAECALGVCARTYVTGGREGVVELFRRGEYPFGAVGRVSVIWRPAPQGESESGEDANRTVWIFAHASFYANVVQLLRETFALESCGQDDGDDAKVPPLATYHNTQTGVTLSELKDTLNRFRLTGPLSHAVLAKAFKPKNPALADTDAESWFNKFLSNEADATVHRDQSAYWQSIQTIRSATELTPNMVLALNIEDPRLNRPQKRTKALPAACAIARITQPAGASQMPPNANQSALWSREQRDRCSAAKMSTGEFCTQRNRHTLVPGERCAFEDGMQPMPVLLVQRPGSEDERFKRLGYGGGWDVIVPNGYGISTWMCLIMWGARAGGLREVETVCREGGRDEFLPDTVPAQVKAAEEEQRLREEFFKRPQNKRINYNKLSVNSPFLCRWSQLIADWSATPAPSPPPSTPTTPTTADQQLPTPFYVLRNRTHLQLCQRVIAREAPFASLLPHVAHADRCLIPVHVRMLTRGSPDNFALLCAPKPADMRRNARQRVALDAQPVHTEPMRPDAGESERKRLRAAHVQLLTRLRRRRVRAKRREQEHAERRVLIAPPRTAQMVREQLERMRELWLPANVSAVRAQCSREVLGYVTQANFSLSEATVAGVAYVTLMGLRALVAAAAGGEKKVAAGEPQRGNGRRKGRGRGQAEAGCLVLVRGTSSRQYRLASMRIGV